MTHKYRKGKSSRSNRDAGSTSNAQQQSRAEHHANSHSAGHNEAYLRPGVIPPSERNTRLKLQICLPPGLRWISSAVSHERYPTLYVPPKRGPFVPAPVESIPVRYWRDLPELPVEIALEPRSVSTPPPTAVGGAPHHPQEQEDQRGTKNATPTAPATPSPQQQQQQQEQQEQQQPTVEALSNRQKKLLYRDGECPHYCDTCQQGFDTAEKLEEHMKLHIFCAYPGCHFTCRADKAHRLQEHEQMLHLRENPPNLLDAKGYVEERRSRYPTQETRTSTVEELFYARARGVRLPLERYQWLKRMLELPEYQYLAQQERHVSQNTATAVGDGASRDPPVEPPTNNAVPQALQVGHKRQRSAVEVEREAPARGSRWEEGSSGVSGGSAEGSHTSCTSRSDGRVEHHEQRNEEAGAEMEGRRITDTHVPPPPPPNAPPKAAEPKQSAISAAARPLGSLLPQDDLLLEMLRVAERDGNLVMVELARKMIREKEATICSSAAPPPPPPPPPPQRDVKEQEELYFYEDVTNPGASGREAAEGGQDADAPAPVSAHREGQPQREITRVMAPVAAAKQARLSRAQQQQQQQQQQQKRQGDGAAAPTSDTHLANLFERLTQDANVDENGLLLQATRFFTMTNFMERDPRPPSRQ